MSFNYSSSLGAGASAGFEAIMNQSENQQLAWKNSAKMTVDSTNQSFSSANAQKLELDAQANQQMTSAGWNIAGGVAQASVSAACEYTSNKYANAANREPTVNEFGIKAAGNSAPVAAPAAAPVEGSAQPAINSENNVSTEVVGQSPGTSTVSNSDNTSQKTQTDAEKAAAKTKEMNANNAKSWSNRGYTYSSGASSILQGVGGARSASYVQQQGDYRKEGAVATAVAQAETAAATAGQTLIGNLDQLKQTVQGTLSAEISALLTVRG